MSRAISNSMLFRFAKISACCLFLTVAAAMIGGVALASQSDVGSLNADATPTAKITDVATSKQSLSENQTTGSGGTQTSRAESSIEIVLNSAQVTVVKSIESSTYENGNTGSGGDNSSGNLTKGITKPGDDTSATKNGAAAEGIISPTDSAMSSTEQTMVVSSSVSSVGSNTVFVHATMAKKIYIPALSSGEKSELYLASSTDSLPSGDLSKTASVPQASQPVAPLTPPLQPSGILGTLSLTSGGVPIPFSTNSMFSRDYVLSSQKLWVTLLFIVSVMLLSSFIVFLKKSGYRMAPRAGIRLDNYFATPRLMSYKVSVLSDL